VLFKHIESKLLSFSLLFSSLLFHLILLPISKGLYFTPSSAAVGRRRVSLMCTDRNLGITAAVVGGRGGGKRGGKGGGGRR
jgi:hypothetical protein